MDRNPYAPPTSSTQAAPAAPETVVPGSPSGLAGWLIVVCLGLIITTFRLAKFVAETYPPMFRNGTWQDLTTPGAPHFHPFLAPTLIVEIIGNLLMVAAAIYLLFLFFRKSWRFPKTYVAFMISNLVFMVADLFAVSLVLPEQPVMGPDTVTELFRAVIGVGIWVPYMLISGRVKNTFVRIDS
jgi:hypothetical protein